MVDFSNLFKPKTTSNAQPIANVSGNGAPTFKFVSKKTVDNSGTDSAQGTASATKKGSITIGGEKHSLVISEDGTVWDYNATDNNWVTRDSKGDSSFYEASSSAAFDSSGKINLSTISVTQKTVASKGSSTDYSLKSGSLLLNSINTSNYTVAVIDDFTTSLFDDSDSSTQDVDITHGGLVSSILKENNDDSNSTNDVNVSRYNVGNKDMSYSSILAALKDISARNKDSDASNNISAVNLSLGVSQMFSSLGLPDNTNLSTPSGKATVRQALIDSGETDLVAIIDQISKMSQEGTVFYISAGNDADDVYSQKGDEYYSAYASYDTNHDNVITGSELKVFNALTIASGVNVHVVGATTQESDIATTKKASNGEFVANYSDENGTVNGYENGDVYIEYLGENSSGKYMWDIDGDGLADIYSNTNPDGATIGQHYYEDGTSFASPKKASKNYLA